MHFVSSEWLLMHPIDLSLSRLHFSCPIVGLFSSDTRSRKSGAERERGRGKVDPLESWPRLVMEPTVPAHAVTEVFEWLSALVSRQKVKGKPLKSVRDLNYARERERVCEWRRLARRRKDGGSFAREEGERSRARARKKNEEVGDTSPGAGRWGVYGNFSFGDRYARFAYFRDQTFIGRILSSRQ